MRLHLVGWISVLALLTALLAPGPLHAADKRSGAADALMKAEDLRLKAMTELLKQSEQPAFLAAIPQPEIEGHQPCGATFTRRVDVATAPELRRALEQARPGDLIVLADGVYVGQFVAGVSGSPAAPITLCGSRQAILDGGSIDSLLANKATYGLHLRADYWVLAGFRVRNARKGIVLDGASHNILRSLQVAQIGEEGVHFRSFSSDNRLELSWIHHVGLLTPRYGEGVYIGSAHSNWTRYSGGKPDASDRNRIVNNLIGPHVPAEAVDVKEGTTGGLVSDNVFLGIGLREADSWIDVKGNRYRVEHNSGMYDPDSVFVRAVEVNQEARGWGLANLVAANRAYRLHANETLPPFRAYHDQTDSTSIVLPRRSLPYTLAELSARFPTSLVWLAPDTLLLREHLVIGPGARLDITDRSVRELRLLSTSGRFVSVAGMHSHLNFRGSADRRVLIRSWDSRQGAPDQIVEDGRAYITTRSGRFDVERVDFTDLGFGTGRTSGVAWKGSTDAKSYGDVLYAGFFRNYFGAYTYEAEGMRWIGNTFSDNVVYGFDPHDYSNNFLVEGNVAANNGKHGLIFSRGCDGNILRRNKVYGNRGHGIMIDDGKVAPGKNPRHAYAVPSNDNLIEQNEAWNNEVGIAIEGGSGNRVRSNSIRDNRYGITLKDAATRGEVSGNTIEASGKFAIYVSNQSGRNRIVANIISGGQGGLMIKDSVANLVQDNLIEAIAGRGIVLIGDVSHSRISGNRIKGRGSNAIDSRESFGARTDLFAQNHTAGWEQTGPPTYTQALLMFFWYHPGLLLWVTILGVPTLTWAAYRWRRHRPLG